AATAILGGGALAVLAAGVGANGFVPKGLEKGGQAAADVAMSVAKFSPINAAMMHAGSSTGKAAGIAAAGVGIAALTAGQLVQFSNDHGDAPFVGPAIAGATLVATAGTAVGISKTPWMKGLSGGKPMAALANGTLAAAALIGAASAAQMPVRQFVSDAKAAHASKEDLNPVTAIGASAIGAVGGYAGARVGLEKIIPEDGIRFKLPFGKGTEIHLPKHAGGKHSLLGIVGVGAAVGGVALGAAGFGLSATMPEPHLAAISTGVGAGLGALAGAKLRGATAKAGAIVGTGLGLSASTLMPGAHGDKVAKQPELVR
ncbi:MAG: hypothetical protein JWM25_511, partial [Thermoleophilia bacterium]|nr:hypothetical protein [Thermoleophilia bacterium]